MTQTRSGLESLPAKEDSTLSPPLLYWQSLHCSESQLVTVFLLWSAAVCAQSGSQLTLIAVMSLLSPLAAVSMVL